MPIVPVTINDTYETNVLLDTASTNIFVTRNAIDVLGISGKQVSNTLYTLNTANNNLSEVIEIKLMSAINNKCITILLILLMPYLSALQRSMSVHMYTCATSL